jgi:hypothetical protein
MITNKFFLKATVGLAFGLACSFSALAADPPLTGRAKEIAERFAAADKNHDGKLTLAEAQAGMPRVAEAFEKIDVDNKGYLTLAQIQEVAANAP